MISATDILESSNDSDTVQRPKRTTRKYPMAPPVTTRVVKKRKNAGRKSTRPKTSARSVSVGPSSIAATSRQLPVMVGDTYVKVENVNINRLLVMCPNKTSVCIEILINLG